MFVLKSALQLFGNGSGTVPLVVVVDVISILFLTGFSCTIYLLFLEGSNT